MIHILIMISAGAGGPDAIRQYESKVVPIIREYGGKMLSAFRPLKNPPDEIHLIEFLVKQSQLFLKNQDAKK